ncbi:hypothetical protein DPMN_093868 [Dreissena polymorpha]|uniref:Uncharacterized protein n=1 Tax=Dreissena polymorpha TaxID=45954 RepID=A0A9D4CT87_DREPO|nr:hypothetical protein DPMN_057292 [Dreissena polymorpha]KAH3851388.1 hypothetical protein DPMN_093868 [Dreissena polymorpha]
MVLQGVHDPAPCTPVWHGSSSLKEKGVSEGKGRVQCSQHTQVTGQPRPFF